MLNACVRAGRLILYFPHAFPLQIQQHIPATTTYCESPLSKHWITCLMFDDYSPYKEHCILTFRCEYTVLFLHMH